jgi:DNA-binding response OmpR family regulator
LEVLPKKILVVESDEVVLVLLAHILTRQAYAVDRARNSVEAEELLGSNDYAAMLVDLGAESGGLRLIESLSTRDKTLLKRVIVVTGALHELPRLEGFGVHSVIKKPFELYSLIDSVAHCVSSQTA